MKKQTKDSREIKVPVKQRETSFSDPLKYKILVDQEVQFTKPKAFEFLELKTFEGERAVRERHVQYLYDEWIAGRFLWQNIMLASAKLGQETYRVNGQHTCWMRVNIPDKFEPVKAPIREMLYQVSDQEQLRALYAAFDRNATRSVGHVSKVMLMNTRAANEIPPSYISKLIPGFRIFFAPDWSAYNASAPDLVGLIEKSYEQLFNLVGRWFGIHYSDAIFMRRAAVIGAMFATFEKNIKSSDEFWSPVANGLNLKDKTDARWQLRRFLESHGHSIVKGMEKVSQEELYCVCLNAWNNWREGNAITRCVIANKRPRVRS